MWGSNCTAWGNSFCGFGPSFGHGPWFMGWVFPLLFWGVIVYLVYSVIRSLFSNKITGQNDSALELLRNRFASGEINEQEYAAQKVVLNKR
ncbi:MAG: putative membrane protein [Desulforhopalus sp.]|jgi:putative membrane protein